MRFLVVHSLEPGTTRARLIEICDSMPAEFKFVCSFVNMSEGKAVCVLRAPSQEAIAKWLDEHHLGYDAIWPVEMECSEGEFIERETAVGAGR